MIIYKLIQYDLFNKFNNDSIHIYSKINMNGYELVKTRINMNG